MTKTTLARCMLKDALRLSKPVGWGVSILLPLHRSVPFALALLSRP